MARVKQAKRSGIPPAALARFKAKVLKGQPGDITASSMEELIAKLHRKSRRRPA
ncbi:MAG: hypothetical protein HY597_05695 [Candidatus Omnitrophica bacterium]|nr:hypothetical protein [Candidatus Omnitrophota bacterium]